MDPALTTALVAAGFSAISAFVGYWRGWANAHRQGRIKELRLKAQMHEQQLIALDLADSLYRLRGRRISAREQAAFNDIATNYGKDCA